MSVRTLIAAFVFLVGPLAGVPQAAIIDVSAGGTFTATNTSSTTAPSYSFSDQFYFSSTRDFTLNYDIFTTGSNPGTLSSVSYGVYSSGSPTPVFTYVPFVISNAAFGYGTGLSLSAGTYFFDLSGSTSSASSVSDTVNFGVSAVPLPPSLSLFGTALLALIGIGLVRRRTSSTLSSALA